jgi:centrosomal protein CEP89
MCFLPIGTLFPASPTQINIKDNQIHELVGKVTKLFEENEKLRNDKTVLVENYNSLYEKMDRSALKSSGGSSLKDNRESLQLENSEMKNDLKMLKILVFRLNKHIEYYQDLLNEREMKFDEPKRDVDEDEVASVWSVNSHLLSPLMNSYEERLKEKNEIIKSYEVELNQVSVKIKKILEENEKLHENFENLNKNSELWLTEKQRLTSQCEILKNKATIHCKRADLAKEKLVEVLKAYEQKVQSQSLDIERLQEAYSRSKGEITTLKNYQKNPEAVAESIKDCQK